MNSPKNTKEIKDKEEITGQNVAVFFSTSSNSPTIELHSSVVRDLLRRNNKVTVYVCDSSFRSPMDNPFNQKSIYEFTEFRIKDAIACLNVRFVSINLGKEPESVPDNVGKLLELGVMSSLSSILKVASKNELTPKWLEAYNNMLTSAKKLYNYFVESINREKYDFVFMYNGRFGDVRPALEATKHCGVGFGLYEMKRGINEIVFINELVHSIEGNTRRALALYEEDKKSAEINGEKFFRNKLEDKSTGDPVFTKDQTKGSLPDEVTTTTKKVIAVYPTSDDEYKFLGEEWGRVPEDQTVEIAGLAKNLSAEEYLIVVKMHPNQARASNNVLQKYYNLENTYPHVIVEAPSSKVDTYALMRRSHMVVTFASTIGVEACHAGKAVILIGDTNWGKLDIAHQVYSGDEGATLIKKGVQPKPVLGAIIWGNYMLSYRDKLPDLEIVSVGNYFVAGRRIGQSLVRRILQLPAKFEISVNKPSFKWGAFLLRLGPIVKNIFQGKWSIH